MSDANEPKWERIVPPNFDNEDESIKDRTNESPKFEPDEALASPEGIRAEAALLYGMGQQLKHLVSGVSPFTVHKNDDWHNNIDFVLNKTSDSDFDIDSQQEAFSGIGDGSIRFMHYEKPIPLHGTGFPVKAFLEIGLHTHDETMEEARVYNDQHPGLIHFYKTMIYLDGGSNLKITSKIPKGLLGHKPPAVQTPQGNLTTGLFRHDTEEITSPITIGKLELAGAALGALITRTQFYKENPPPITSKPPIL